MNADAGPQTSIYKETFKDPPSKQAWSSRLINE